MTGLYYPDGEYKSREDITMKNLPHDTVEHITPIASDDRSFRELGDLFVRRQAEREQARGIPEHVEFKVHTKYPILLVPFGDVHAGGEDVDYKRFMEEIEFVAGTPGAYAMALGDLTDSFFWGKDGQDGQLGAYVEQNKFARAALRMLGEQEKLIACWKGDHDGWSASMGETMYDEFTSTVKSHYLEGVSYVSLWVGDQVYKISGAHRHNGFSIYNKAHAALRIYRDSGEGSDIAITAHNHRKAVITQPVKRFGGDQENVTYIAVGAYKKSDGWLRKQGYARLDDAEIGPQSILLWPNQKKIETYWTVSEGLQRLVSERSNGEIATAK
ncbi:MAG: hypothetical protein KCHDKBKB_00612 [Elusimicrobia bacterium]|nr:hypothetical protein [Elusimicrobiota bacterium]